MSKSKLYLAVTIALLLGVTGSSFAQTVAAKADEGKLIAVLKSDDASHKAKADACRQLAITGTKDAIAPLVALLGDEKLSHMARYALEPMPEPAVDEAFRKALGTLKGKPLVGVIGSIGVRRDAKAVAPLRELLRQHQAGPAVMHAAVRALGSIGTPAAAEVLQSGLDHAPPEGRLSLYEGLFRCAELMAVEGHRDKATEIYDQLCEQDAPHQVRGGALRGAILVRGKEGLPLLRKNLRSDDYILFSAAVQAAQEMPVARVTKVLTAALDKLPADNQIVVIQTLGKRGDPAALPVLFETAQSGPTAVRVAAIKAVVEMQKASAVPVLVKLIDAPEAEVAKAAQEGLGALPNRQADEAVIAMFKSDDINKRATALDLMGRRRMTDSIPTLLRAARQAPLRASVIKMVGELGDAGQLPALLDLLMDVEAADDLAAAEQAVAAVCMKSEDPQAHAGKLTGLLGRAKAAQKTALLRVLGAIGGADALKAVRAAVDSSDAQVRSAAIRALTTWKTPDAAPHLLELAKSTSKQNERTLFLRGYLNFARRGNLPVGQRLSMCREAAKMIQRDDEKKLLLGALSSIESPQTLTLIAPHMDNAGTREEAAMAATGVAEKLLKSRNGARHAAKLVAPLEKVTQVTTNENLASRARKLLQEAKNKASKN